MMKCGKCGFENKDTAKFCTRCGQSLDTQSVPAPNKESNSKYIILALVAVIIILVGAIGYFALDMNSNVVENSDDGSSASEAVESSSSDDESDSQSTEEVSSSQSAKTTQVSKSKSWESIGSYSGSGSGSQTISVPEGKIMVKLSAYPIKNYATNHLYVSGSNGESGGVDWGSKSAVETRSDSFTYTSSSEEVFTIDYYETVSWEVEFFRYQ